MANVLGNQIFDIISNRRSASLRIGLQMEANLLLKFVCNVQNEGDKVIDEQNRIVVLGVWRIPGNRERANPSRYALFHMFTNDRRVVRRIGT